MADEAKIDWRKVLLVWVPWAVAMVAWAVTAVIAYRAGAPVPQPPPWPAGEVRPVVMAPADPPPPNAFGWVRDPAEVAAVKATLPRPAFADTPAGRQADPLPDHAYLWDAYRKIFGKLPGAHDQNPIGSCVGFGSARAFGRTLACQIVQGEPFEYRDVCEEAIYALSRVEIGGGRIRGDGSVGAWAAKGFTRYGGLPRGIYGRHDLTQYDPSRCRAWGRSGLPDELETEAKKYPAGDCANVANWESAKRALAQGYGVFVCSGQGFARQRDENGVCRAQGSWSHCMCLDGYHVAADGKEYGHIENSWGPDYHVGPTGWGDPNTAGFWADAKVIDRMLSEGDSWAVSAASGFPSRKLDWLVHARPNLGDRHATAAGRPVLPGVDRFALAW